MLDSQSSIGVSVGPPGNISGRKYSGDTGLEKFIDRDPAIEEQSGGFSESDIRPHTDSRDNEVAFDPIPIIENDCVSIDALYGTPEMKHDALLFVDILD
jgi:hypothetical protein